MGRIPMDVKNPDEKKISKRHFDRGIFLIIDSKDRDIVVNLFNILWERHKIASRIEILKPFQPHSFNSDIEFWVDDFKKEAKKIVIISVNNNLHRNQMIEGSANRNIIHLNLKSNKDINFAILKVRLIFFMMNKILDERRWII